MKAAPKGGMFSLCVNGQPRFVALKAIDLQTEQVLGDVTAQLKSIAVCANILLFGSTTVMDRGVLPGVQMTFAYKLSYFHRLILSALVTSGAGCLVTGGLAPATPHGSRRRRP